MQFRAGIKALNVIVAVAFRVFERDTVTVVILNIIVTCAALYCHARDTIVNFNGIVTFTGVYYRFESILVNFNVIVACAT